MKNLLLLFCAVFLALTIAGCASKGPQKTSFSSLQGVGAAATTFAMTNQVSPELLRPSSNFFTLGPGDRLEIEILGQPDSHAEALVGPDGRMYYHLAPGIDVWGLTLGQTRSLLEEKIAPYIENPQVALNLREIGSKYVWILGRLKKPGIYPMTAPMTIVESLALAGGTARSSSTITTEELADLRHSFVMRQGQLLPVDFNRLLRKGDMTQNVYLQPDDFVYVPSALAQEVYVLGAVRAPRIVPYTEGMTLAGALAGAAGPAKIDWLSTVNPPFATPDAYMSHVGLVRGSLAQPELTIVDANAIIKGRAADVPLEPGDIIYVPNAPLSTLKRYLNMIVSTFISTVAANEGANAGGSSVVGVSIPIGGTTTTPVR
jgi:polysaccharide biosynthesis/export protein